MSERESVRTVEGRRPPGAGVVASAATRAHKQTGMESGFGMARFTSRREAAKDVVDVTACALQPHMGAGERELGQVVIEGHFLP